MRTYLFIGVLAVTACTPLAPPGMPAPHSATIVNAPFGKTWEAVIDVFATRNIPIKTVDRASGLIAAEEATVTRDSGLLFADCGKAFGTPIPPNRANYNVRVKGDSTASTVQINALWKDTDYASGRVVDCATKGAFETAVERDIKTRAEAR